MPDALFGFISPSIIVRLGKILFYNIFGYKVSENFKKGDGCLAFGSKPFIASLNSGKDQKRYSMCSRVSGNYFFFTLRPRELICAVDIYH